MKEEEADVVAFHPSARAKPTRVQAPFAPPRQSRRPVPLDQVLLHHLGPLHRELPGQELPDAPRLPQGRNERPDRRPRRHERRQSDCRRSASSPYLLLHRLRAAYRPLTVSLPAPQTSSVSSSPSARSTSTSKSRTRLTPSSPRSKPSGTTVTTRTTARTTRASSAAGSAAGYASRPRRGEAPGGPTATTTSLICNVS